MTRPFRLTSPIPLERDIHRDVARLLDIILLPPAMWFTYPAGASTLSRQQAARHSEVGLKRGLPDIWLLCNAVYCIELKRPKTGALSKTRIVRTKRGGERIVLGQADVFPKLIAAGVKEIAICRSVEDVLHCLSRWQIPTRGRLSAASSSTISVPASTTSRSCSTPTTRASRSAKSRSHANSSRSTPIAFSKPA